MTKPALLLATLAVSTVLGALTACLDGAPEESAPTAEAPSEAAAAVVGRWQFVYDDAIRGRVEARLSATMPAGPELEAAKRAAEDEAATSVIELTEEGELFSWVNGELHLGARYELEATGPGTFRATRIVEGARETTTLTLRGADTMVIDDPTKGPLTFRRAR